MSMMSSLHKTYSPDKYSAMELIECRKREISSLLQEIQSKQEKLSLLQASNRKKSREINKSIKQFSVECCKLNQQLLEFKKTGINSFDNHPLCEMTKEDSEFLEKEVLNIRKLSEQNDQYHYMYENLSKTYRSNESTSENFAKFENIDKKIRIYNLLINKKRQIIKSYLDILSQQLGTTVKEEEIKGLVERLQPLLSQKLDL